MQAAIRKLLKAQLIVIGVFVVFKLIRPRVLAEEGYVGVKLFLYSFPNLCEGILGVLTLTMLGLWGNQYTKFRARTIYLVATVLAGGYVLSQEFKWHHLGGNNVYDPNDVLFSVLGLGLGLVWVNYLHVEPVA